MSSNVVTLFVLDIDLHAYAAAAAAAAVDVSATWVMLGVAGCCQ